MVLSRFSHQLAVEAHDGPAPTSLRLLAVLNAGFENVGARHAVPEVAGRCRPALLAGQSRARQGAGPWREPDRAAPARVRSRPRDHNGSVASTRIARNLAP